MSARANHEEDRATTQGAPPEAYWVARGAKVIGRGGLNRLREGRQVATYRAIARAIEAHRARTVLDLGCNVSALGQLLYDWGYDGEYVGADNNPFGLELAAQYLQPLARGRVRLVRANIRALPFRRAAAPIVVMKDVLEHMEDFRACFREAARVARDALIIANFIPWSDEPPEVRRDPAGFYLNRYRRADVYAFAADLGCIPARVEPTFEADGRPNEVVTFVNARNCRGQHAL